ncbi:MAG: hypothetical protein V1495_02340 [Pseudomonadota bacterium]
MSLVTVPALLSAQTAGNVFPGHVVTRTELTAAPVPGARVLLDLYREQRVDIISQTKSYYRVRTRDSSGTVREGYVPKGAVVGDPLTGNSEEISTFVGPTQEDEYAKDDVRRIGRRAIGIFFAPVYNIRRYGTNQFKAGVDANFRLSPNTEIGFPAAYTFGHGFSSLQGGIQGTMELRRWKKTFFYGRMAALFERFAGNDRSFMAGTVDLGFGFRTAIDRKIWLDIEPFSAEGMLFATHRVPLNFRGQGLVKLRFVW